MVLEADQHQVKLTIDFTPPWANMILENDVFLRAVTRWSEAGHELAVHHHPYWVSTVRGTSWDGYTNTAQADIDFDDLGSYVGNMEDYVALLNQLPGTRTSGTLGLNQTKNLIDWPEDLLYSFEGHDFEDIVSQPELVEYDEREVWQMNHGLFWNVPPAQLEAAYHGVGADDIFAVVTHVSNYEESSQTAQAVKDYFSFLASADPTGMSFVTVT